MPTGIFGALLSALLWRLDNNVYVQIGIIMLIGLAAKNAMLIVEFARERRAHGASIAEAAADAARLRFRPILMTSFAFIIGVIPLMFAHGAGAASRQSLGSTVFAGMLAATCLGIFFTPTLYELCQRWIERGKHEKPAESAARTTGRGTGMKLALALAAHDPAHRFVRYRRRRRRRPTRRLQPVYRGDASRLPRWATCRGANSTKTRCCKG